MDTFSPNVADNPQRRVSSLNAISACSDGDERLSGVVESGDAIYGDAKLELDSESLESIGYNVQSFRSLGEESLIVNDVERSRDAHTPSMDAEAGSSALLA